MPLKNIIVLKVGTSTLARADSAGLLDEQAMANIGSQLLELQVQGYGIVIVSSAAITAGMGATGTDLRPEKSQHMPELQRLASVGWRHVLNAWDQALPGATIGELLVTKYDMDRAGEREELLHVTRALLNHGDIVIVNENDALSHDEIAFGDNDTLAATFAVRVHQARLCSGEVKLVILSDVEGLYKDKHDSSTLITRVDAIDDVAHLAGGAATAFGTGGMRTKMAAARIATEAGIEMWLAHGRRDKAIMQTLKGEVGTHFTVRQG